MRTRMGIGSRSLLAICLWAMAALAASAQTVLTGGLATPFKTDLTPGGNLIVAETGSGANDGQLTLVTFYGAQFNLLSGLPSGVDPDGVIGPTAVADAHRTLYVLIGVGDVLGESTTPPAQVPNPDGLSSPIFSSLLRARFDPVPDGIREGFALGAGEIRSLADGHEVVLENGSGERVELLLLADFRDLEPDPVLSVRQANPFALALVGELTQEDLDELGAPFTLAQANSRAQLHPETVLGQRLLERSTLYVVDAAMNTVSAVSAATGRSRVLTRIPPLPNPLFPGLGGPVMDPVPTGIHVRADGDLLVTILPGFPFPPGAGKVYLIDPETGGFTVFQEDLSMATDVLEIDGALYVLELSTDFLAGAPGRLVRFDSPGAAPEVVAGGLIGAAGLDYNPANELLVVTEAFTGLIKTIPLP